MSDKYEERIAALLNKAEGTDNEEEAAAFTAKALELMVRYGIDEAKIAARRMSKTYQGAIVTEEIVFEGEHHWNMAVMATYAVAAFETMKPLVSKGYKDSVPVTVFHIIGYETEVRVAKALVQSLAIQVLAALQNYRYVTGRDSKSVGEFIDGFGAGAAMKISEARRRILKEDDEPGTDLVLASRKHLVDEFVRDEIKPTEVEHDAGNGMATAFGMMAGQQADTGDKRIGTRHDELADKPFVATRSGSGPFGAGAMPDGYYPPGMGGMIFGGGFSTPSPYRATVREDEAPTVFIDDVLADDDTGVDDTPDPDIDEEAAEGFKAFRKKWMKR